MAKQYHHNNFSLTDIERYLQGRMSAREMHELEKAALQDPFLADAMEGYAQAHLPTARQHLNEAAALLQQPAKVVDMPPARRRYGWRIAAVVVLLAGMGTAGWFLFNGQNNPVQNNPKELAQNTTVPAPALPQPTDTIKASEAPASPKMQPLFPKKAVKQPQVFKEPAANDQQAAGGSLQAAGEQPSAAANQQLAMKQATNDGQRSTMAATSDATLQKTRTESLSFMAKPDTALPKEQPTVVVGYGTQRRALPSMAPVSRQTVYVLKGKVVDDKQQPLQNATVKPVNGKALAMTDESGRFTLRSTDSIASVSVSSLGYDGTVAVIQNNQPNTIQLKEAESSLGEMVVTEMRSKKQANKPVSQSNDAYPAGGWQSFQEYVYKKLHRQPDTTGSNATLSGDVELEFQLNAKGEPYNVNVTRSFNQAIDSQAVDALQKGPRWITKNDKKKKKITVRF